MMDARRNSGSYARPVSYYSEHDPSDTANTAQTGNMRAFSAKARGKLPNDPQSIQNPAYAPSQAYPTLQANYAAPESDRMRAPQAAMYVPKPRAPLYIPVAHYSQDHQQDAYAPTGNLIGNTTKARSARQAPRPKLDIPAAGESHYPQTSFASPQSYHASGEVQSGSVPDRSPLQNLEGKLDDISKEDKRARMERAERRASERTAGNESERNDTSRLAQQGYGLGPSSDHERGTGGARAEHMNTSRGTRSAPFQTSAAAPRPGQIDSRPGDSYHDTQGQPARQSSASKRFRRAPEALCMGANGHETKPEDYEQQNERGDLNRTDSKNYRHRARDAGFIGAAAAAGANMGYDGAVSKGERRSSANHKMMPQATIGRSNSKRLQKRNPQQNNPTSNRDPQRIPESQDHLQDQLQSHRTGAVEGLKAAIKHQDPDPLPPSAVKSSQRGGPTYLVPPQTAAGQQARAQVGFVEFQPSQPDPTRKDRNYSKSRSQQSRQPQASALEEWRKAGIAKLAADDLLFDDSRHHGTQLGRSGQDSRSSAPRQQGPGGLDGNYEEQATTFRPPLYLKCGPLLRYSGMRRERLARPGRSGIIERDIWRGSIMIVTRDAQSSYQTPPILRLFAQPMTLLQAPVVNQEGEVPSELQDPLSGQVKLSPTGQALFVKHVDYLEGGLDLSRVEDENGLYETLKTVEPGQGQPHQQSRISSKDGEATGKYREVKAARLHAERGCTFWRFNVEVELGSQQARVAYRINRGPAIGFWVPGRGQTMNMMFHSCNGFSLSVDSNLFSGPDPLWRDVLKSHQSRPFHVMIGGGDQIYNDAAMRDTTLFSEWLQTKNPEHKHRAEFSPDMQNELETFYLERYSMWFSQGMFGMANSQIPMVNMWDDHDIIDGFGSYPHHFMSTRVFSGLGTVAFKYYMLFQHQTVTSETYREEPSWILGASRGPYINEFSRSIFMSLGPKVALLGLDCRTERMRDEVMSQESYDLVFSRCRSEITRGETKHLIVLLGIPIAYPRLNFLENILTSRMMDPIKAIGRTGALGGFINKFDGGVEILDDLDDHWTAKHHKQERNWFIQELQELAAEKSVRITILGGDVHLGAVGQFYSNKKLGIPKDRDHRYMPNVISSAIVNTPPPAMMGDILNRRNKVHHLDADTDEDMIPMFEQDVDGKPRSNHRLLPRRNYCTISEYQPGSTPPPTAPKAENTMSPQDTQEDRRYPPGSMKRSRSMTRGVGSLVRRLSGSRSRNPPGALSNRQHESQPQRRNGSGSGVPRSQSQDPDPNTRTSAGTFLRRPTDLSNKTAMQAAAKGGPEGSIEAREQGLNDLENGLDIALRVEINQRNPAGSTVPYRLLVPALWYEGHGDANTTRFKTRRASLLDRLRGRRHSQDEEYSDGEYSEGPSDGSQSPNLERQQAAQAQDQAQGRLAQGPEPTVQFPGQTPQSQSQGQPSRPQRQYAASQPRPQSQDQRQYSQGPPPSAPAIATQQGRQASYRRPPGIDGTQELSQPHYNSSSLPPSHQAHPQNNNTHRQSGPIPVPASSERDRSQPRQKTGLFSFGRRKSTKGSEGYGRERYGEDTESEADDVPEDERDEQPSQPRQRRASKAERLLGLGDEDGRGASGGARAGDVQQAQMLPSEREKEKPGWRIWR